jgi:hypothetical protein
MLIVVSKEDRTDPFPASQFQPPSASRPMRIRSTIAPTSTPKYAPASIVLPLMQGSTSPSKYRCPACSQRPFSTSLAGALARSRSTCHRMAGSPSSSQPITLMTAGYPAAGRRSGGRLRVPFTRGRA